MQSLEWWMQGLTVESVRIPRTAELVQFFQRESTDPPTADLVQVIKREIRDPRTADLVRIFKGDEGIHGQPILSEFLK